MRANHDTTLAFAISALFVACDTQPTVPTADAQIIVSIAPLTYRDASDACYTLSVFDASFGTVAADPTKGRVWHQQHVCASSYGAGAEISYVGPCVAGEMNTTLLVLEALYESPNTYGSGTALGAADYVNPCPADRPCKQATMCRENADMPVHFDITVMRRAWQGFFDIGVDFEDLFCSAKIDCQYANGKPIKLLHNPRRSPSERDDTIVLAVACTTGDNENTSLHMDDVVVVCGQEATTAVVAQVDPASGPGNLYNYSPATTGRTLHVPPSAVPDARAPRLDVSDAPPGYGPGSWRGIAAGFPSGSNRKSNWHARYVKDGDGLTALFPTQAATMKVADLAEISYYTKRPAGTPAGRDWWIQIYTRCSVGGVPAGAPDCGTGWYYRRYINDYGTHAAIGSWVRHSTATGMTFDGQSWADFVTAHGGELIEMISVQTDSGWDGFPGLMDGLEIKHTDGSLGRVDFGSALFQAQVSMGAEQLFNLAGTTPKPANKLYWTVALGLDTSFGIRSGLCRVKTKMTASRGGDLRWSSPGTAYPDIVVELPLTWADTGDKDLTCGAHGLDGPQGTGTDPVIRTDYSEGEHYANCLVGNFPGGPVNFCTERPAYDAIPRPLPGNVPSLGYEATSTSEFGDAVDVAGAGFIRSVEVTFSSWAKHSEYFDHPVYGLNTASFTHPITVNVYAVGPDDAAGRATVGAKLGSVTQSITIPYRPEPDTTHCSGGPWWDGSNCFNGKAFNWTFDLSGLQLSAPRKVLLTIAYNTQSYGAAPIGTAGPYDSFNVGLNTVGVVAGDLDGKVVYLSSTWAGAYSDPSAGIGTLRADYDWTPYVPAFAITAY